VVVPAHNFIEQKSGGSKQRFPWSTPSSYLGVMYRKRGCGPTFLASRSIRHVRVHWQTYAKAQSHALDPI